MLLLIPKIEQFKALNGEDVTNMESMLALHAWFARNVEKYQKAHTT